MPGKSIEPEKIKEIQIYRQEKLEPLLEEAIRGEKAVFFVDAAHFVHRAYLGFLWCFTRTFICLPSGRKRFNVLGAVNAVTKEIITITIERVWKLIRNECLYSKYYANFADFKTAISNCIINANTNKQEKLDSLLTLNFQTFKEVQVLAV